MTTNNNKLDDESAKNRTYIAVLTRHNETQVKVISETCDVQGLMGRVALFPFWRYHDTS